MKPNKILNRISSLALAAAALFAVSALTACSSDTEPASTPDPIPDGMANITISVANSDMATRSGDIQEVAATSDESKISTLWLFIYKYDEDSKKFVFQKRLQCNGSNNTSYVYNQSLSHEDYTQIYKSSLTPGKYHFYVIANTPHDDMNGTNNDWIYGTGIYGDPAEAIIQQHSLVSSLYQKLSYGTRAGKYLPMASNANEVVSVFVDGKESEASLDKESGDVTIGTGSYTINIDMKFSLAKVRYTILADLDKYDDVESSWAYDYFDVNSIEIRDVATGTCLKNTASITTPFEYADAPVDITTYGKKYTFAGAMSEIVDNPGGGLTNVTDQVWTNSKKKAYQGILYLPTNSGTVVGNDMYRKTRLILKYKTSENGEVITKNIFLPDNIANQNDESHILARGCFYDVIIMLTSSGVEVKVVTKKWIGSSPVYFPI